MKMLVPVILCLALTNGIVSAQNKVKSKKLSKDEAANLTTEQRFVHETDRKTKQGKRKLSMAQKVRTEKKQTRSAKHTRTPARKTKRAKSKN